VSSAGSKGKEEGEEEEGEEEEEEEEEDGDGDDDDVAGGGGSGARRRSSSPLPLLSPFTTNLLKRKAIFLPGQGDEVEKDGGTLFIPITEAELFLTQERKETRRAFGLAFETSLDVNALEDENKALTKEVSILLSTLKDKDEYIAGAHDKLRERVQILKRLEELEMTLNARDQVMEKTEAAQAAQYREEQMHLQQQYEQQAAKYQKQYEQQKHAAEDQLKVNGELLEKTVVLQKENLELKEKIERLGGLIQLREDEIIAVKAAQAKLGGGGGGGGEGSSASSSTYALSSLPPPPPGSPSPPPSSAASPSRAAMLFGGGGARKQPEKK
jgi:hypothetical protein